MSCFSNSCIKMIKYIWVKLCSHKLCCRKRKKKTENMLSFQWLPWSIWPALSNALCLPVFSWHKPQLYFSHIRGPVPACNFSAENIILVHKSFYLMHFKGILRRLCSCKLCKFPVIHNSVYSFSVLWAGGGKSSFWSYLWCTFSFVSAFFSLEYPRWTHNKVTDKICILKKQKQYKSHWRFRYLLQSHMKDLNTRRWSRVKPNGHTLTLVCRDYWDVLRISLLFVVLIVGYFVVFIIVYIIVLISVYVVLIAVHFDYSVFCSSHYCVYCTL